MADCILLIYLYLIQVAAISKLLPSSLLKDAAKIQTSKKNCGQGCAAKELSYIAGEHLHRSNHVRIHIY